MIWYSVFCSDQWRQVIYICFAVQQGCPHPSSTLCYCIGATCPENKTIFGQSGLGGVETFIGMYADDVLMYLKKLAA